MLWERRGAIRAGGGQVAASCFGEPDISSYEAAIPSPLKRKRDFRGNPGISPRQ